MHLVIGAENSELIGSARYWGSCPVPSLRFKKHVRRWDGGLGVPPHLDLNECNSASFSHGSCMTHPVFPGEDGVYPRAPLVKHNTFIAAFGYSLVSVQVRICTQAALEQDDSWQGTAGQ